MAKEKNQVWFVYIVECRGGQLYTGMTNDLSSRIEAHNNGTGAKFTRGRAPVRLIYSEECASRSESLKREAAIKRLERSKKLALIAGTAK